MRTFFIEDIIEIENIINACEICFVGITELDGSPYVIPMNFAYSQGEVILHSAPEGKHLQLLENDNRVCVTFCSDRKLMYQHPDVACSYSMNSKSVLVRGKVTFIDNLQEKEHAMNLFMEKYTQRTDFKYSVPALKNVKVWKVNIEKMTAKAFGQNFKMPQ
jgi:nitroimidazol reductase NimA-like FMN-containing flavoprotein (pyridoxamine 5'-phosphate oxidase superfamily)